MKKIILQKVNNYLKKISDNKWKVYVLIYFLCSPSNVVFASAATADSKWNNFTDFILPWVTRFGGGIILVGAIEFGVGFKQEDANARTIGIRTVIGGAIVFAVGLSGPTFLA